MKAIRLRTEYLVNPLGIDVQHPRLMWNCEGGVKQSAYQIVTDNWDSGKVETSSMHAVYPKELVDRERVNWKIRLFDENGIVALLAYEFARRREGLHRVARAHAGRGCVYAFLQAFCA